MKERLLSRKLWITVLTAIVLILNEQYNEAVLLVIAYLGVQGASDAVSSYKGSSVVTSLPENLMSQNDDNAVDQSKVVSGKSIPLFDETPKE